MDNSSIAIVSLAMLTLGVVNGMILGTVFDVSGIQKLRNILDKAIDQKFQSDQLIDDLKEKLTKEKKLNHELVVSLRGLVNKYGKLPPPEGPIERCDGCCEAESDSEFDCPTSPDGQQSNKD